MTATERQFVILAVPKRRDHRTSARATQGSTRVGQEVGGGRWG